LRAQTSRAADQDKIMYALALFRPPVKDRQPIVRGLGKPPGQSLAGQ
jgi:hypothetical protein